MNPFIAVISGAINSGKTTVARELVSLAPGTAHIEVDSLREFVSWMPLEQSIPLNLENAQRVAEVFLGHGLNVIISYPVTTSEFDRLHRALAPLARRIELVSLDLPMEIAASDRGTRSLTDWERGRVREQYALGVNGRGTVVENHRRSAPDTARAILEMLGRSD